MWASVYVKQERTCIILPLIRKLLIKLGKSVKKWELTLGVDLAVSRLISAISFSHSLASFRSMYKTGDMTLVHGRYDLLLVSKARLKCLEAGLVFFLRIRPWVSLTPILAAAECSSLISSAGPLGLVVGKRPRAPCWIIRMLHSLTPHHGAGKSVLKKTSESNNFGFLGIVQIQDMSWSTSERSIPPAFRVKCSAFNPLVKDPSAILSSICIE
ncbi:hypothetical protein NC651_034634 [Populus alba x Populus x berolinensis]|nr:hypothetical protein NC651_034634 [Populus alba x Populus x berolinensis]